MKSCVFCKILTGELEGSFVVHGRSCSAFLDIHPVNPGHVLIVPRAHHERFTQIDPNTVCEMFEISHTILKAIETSPLSCEGANLFLSDGYVAGQDVPHSHLHIAPRFSGDGYQMGFRHSASSKASRSELNTVANTLSNLLT